VSSARPDALVHLYQTGDARDGTDTVHQPDIHARVGLQPVMWRPFAGSLAQGASISLDANDRPDYWVITISKAVAAATLQIWPYVVAGGPGLTIGAGGWARLPGLDHFLTLQAGGGIVAYSAVAVRGFDLAELFYGG
jgi:hypothetical protein